MSNEFTDIREAWFHSIEFGSAKYITSKDEVITFVKGEKLTITVHSKDKEPYILKTYKK